MSVARLALLSGGVGRQQVGGALHLRQVHLAVLQIKHVLIYARVVDGSPHAQSGNHTLKTFAHCAASWVPSDLAVPQ